MLVKTETLRENRKIIKKNLDKVYKYIEKDIFFNCSQAYLNLKVVNNMIKDTIGVYIEVKYIIELLKNSIDLIEDNNCNITKRVKNNILNDLNTVKNNIEKGSVK